MMNTKYEFKVFIRKGKFFTVKSKLKVIVMQQQRVAKAIDTLYLLDLSSIEKLKISELAYNMIFYLLNVILRKVNDTNIV